MSGQQVQGSTRDSRHYNSGDSQSRRRGHGRRKPKQSQNGCVINTILGNTGLWYRDNYIEYQYKWWWLQLNPKLLFPEYRTMHRKNIVVNGKVKGYAEVRSGLIPRPYYTINGKGIGVKLRNFIRRHTGLLCHKYEKEYVKVKIRNFTFTVIYRIADSGACIGEVFDKATDRQEGTFVFLPDFSRVQIRCDESRMLMTMCTICGYISDLLVYQVAAQHMTRQTRIVT